jgi:diacylglycerol O-acyltransferase
MDVLSPLDAAFLRLEGRDSPLHIASVAVLDGPAPTYDEVLALFASKLPLVPRYRQRVQEVPLWLGRPVWVDHPELALRDHVRHTALPTPGDDRQLRTLCGRLLSLPLDRRRPLWEAWFVEGLAGGRWALLSKVHHCMVDGIAGTDLLLRVLDLDPFPEPPPADSWVPAPAPGRLRLLSTALTTIPGPRAGAQRVATAVRHPREAAGELLEDAHGLATWAGLARPASRSSLTGPLMQERGWGWAQATLDDVRTVRKAFGGTVNDVVLTLITHGFRALLLSRGEEADAHAVRSLVPVNVRPRHPQPGEALVANRVSAMVAELPVHVADPVARLTAVRAELDRLKVSGESRAGEVVTEVAGLVPPLLLSLGLYGGFRVPHRQLVTVTTNVPGPPFPLWALGRRVRELHPFVPIADRVRTGIAITSYEGVLFFGVTTDAHTVPDVDVLTDGIESALAALVGLAEGSAPAR